jgi:hypothetical protein
MILPNKALMGFEVLEDLVLPADAFFNGSPRDLQVSLRLPSSLKRLCLTDPSINTFSVLIQKNSSLNVLASMMVRRMAGLPYLEEIQILDTSLESVRRFLQSGLEREEKVVSSGLHSGLTNWLPGPGLGAWYRRAQEVQERGIEDILTATKALIGGLPGLQD